MIGAMKISATLSAALLLCAMKLAHAADLARTAAETPSPGSQVRSAKLSSDEAGAAKPLYVGLRRSSYGLRKLNGENSWWVERAKSFATNFPGAQPLILEIISNYQDDGSTEIEFMKPDGYQGSTAGMTFRRGNKLNHEQALSACDAQGVKVILQFEPGNADVSSCFELARVAFAQHPCVIGLGIDGEWFRTKASSDQTGLPITDADAKQWMEQVLRLNPSWILVLKHFESKHLPQNYRNPHLWLLTDSQEFESREEWTKDMHDWQATFKGAPIGVQFGYPKDQKWWAKVARPPVDLGEALLKDLPDCGMLLWVDFTANRVQFGKN